MSRVLTADELGEAGETLFAHLCALAGLTCNKSQRDRTGWDFVVEFPLAGVDRPLALDHRLPISCVVQLKSTAGGWASPPILVGRRTPPRRTLARPFWWFSE